MERLLWICLAGAVGSGTRYLVTVWAGERFGTTFPWGTFVVNVVGCFLIGLIMELALNLSTFPPNLRFALVTGFLGGLTTYSSFSFETVKLFEDGQRAAALGNFALTTVSCFGAAVLGLFAARLFVKA